jgi:nucleoporin NUP82
LVPDSIECKYVGALLRGTAESNKLGTRAVQIGQFYHGAEESAPVAKIDWHPWGEAGSTLLVMTTDGKFRSVVTECAPTPLLHNYGREYDISLDTEEPQQMLTFVPAKKSSFALEDESEREVTSFTFGKGKADWGPLTVYAVMKSGDIYAICPYLPQNA